MAVSEPEFPEAYPEQPEPAQPEPTASRPGYWAKLEYGSILYTLDDIEDHCFRTLEAKKLELTLNLPVLLWIDIISEIRNRNPRNYSQLLRDDMMLRLEDAIERLHEETLFMIAGGPSGSVAARLDPRRQRERRDLASEHLRKAEQERPKR